MNNLQLHWSSEIAEAEAAFRDHSQELRDAGIDRLVLFGSMARGDMTAGSDIDILVVPSDAVSVSGLRLAHWSNMLSDISKRHVDAVAEKFLRESVKARVAEEGFVIFDAR